MIALLGSTSFAQGVERGAVTISGVFDDPQSSVYLQTSPISTPFIILDFNKCSDRDVVRLVEIVFFDSATISPQL